MNKSGKADFVISGQWAKKAYTEAARYGQANIVASSADKTFSYIPELDLSLIHIWEFLYEKTIYMAFILHIYYIFIFRLL